MGAKPSIDHEQVCVMVETGFGNKHIARRLGISEKQVRRIREKYSVQRGTYIGSILDTPDEWDLWDLYLVNESESHVAYQFGVTRQAINQRSNKREAA